MLGWRHGAHQVGERPDSGLRGRGSAMGILLQRVVVLGLLAALAACAAPGPTPPAQGGAAAPPEQSSGREPGRVKVINLALTTIIDGFSIAASSTTGGGGLAYIETHSAALVTADKTSGRPIGRLAVEAPSLENGGLTILPDGRMTATYR